MIITTLEVLDTLNEGQMSYLKRIVGMKDYVGNVSIIISPFHKSSPMLKETNDGIPINELKAYLLIAT